MVEGGAGRRGGDIQEVRTSLVVMETPGDQGDVQNQQCSTCDGSPASCWCVDCGEALCDDCLAAHRRVTLTRSHRVLNHQPEGPRLISPTKFCRTHPSEELQLFCFTCCQLTCRDCQLTEHMNHRFDFVSKAVEGVRKQLEACMQPIRAQMETSRKSLQDMETRLRFLSQSEATMTSRLQRNVDMLTELLKKRFNEITTQIQKVFDVERSMIDRKILKLKQLQKSYVPVTEAAEKARSTSNLPTLVGCISQITSQLKDLEDKDSHPPSQMINLRVITDRSSVEGILNFGKLHVSWIPFAASQEESSSSNSSSSPGLSSSHTSISASSCSSSRPASSSRTGLQPRPDSDAAPPAPLISPAASGSNLDPSSVSQASSAQSFRLAPVVKSRTAKTIEAMNPHLCTLLNQTLPYSSAEAGPPPASTGPAPGHHQNPSHQSGLPLSSSSSKTARGSGGMKRDGPSVSVSERTSKGSDSTVQINVLTKSQLESNSGKMFVKFQWKNRMIRSKSSSASPKNTKSLPGKEQQTQTQIGGLVLTNPQVQFPPFIPGLQSFTYSTPPTYLFLPQVVSSTSQSAGVQPILPPVPDPSLLNAALSPVQPQLILSQHAVTAQNQSALLLLTNTTSPHPVFGTGSGFRPDQALLPVLQNDSLTVQKSCETPQVAAVSVGPPALKEDVPSFQQSSACPEVWVGPESNNQLLPEQHLISRDGPPPSAVTDQQQNADLKEMFGPDHRVQQIVEPEPDKPTSDGSDPSPEAPESGPVDGSGGAHPAGERRPSEQTETRSKEITRGTFDQDLVEVSSGEDGPPPTGSEVERTGTRTLDTIVLSEEQGSSDGESLPEVYNVKPSFEEVQTLVGPVSPGASDDDVTVVENEPPADEIYEAKASRTKERDVPGAPASPLTFEDRVSIALSEEPELGLKLSSTETSDSEDGDLLSANTWQQDYSQLYWQPTVSLLRLPLSQPGPGRPQPRYHFILGNQRDELYLQEVEDDAQSSGEDVSETATDHASDITEDFTELHSPKSPLTLEVISCAACGSSSASKICTVCGRGYHRDCHVPPFGPDIWSELVCSLCQDLSDPLDPYSFDRPKSPQCSSLSLQDQRRCETLLLHLKVEGCRRFSQLNLWSELMLISERLSLHLSPPYQTSAHVVSDLWGLFSHTSQGDPLMDLQHSFQKKLEETFGSDLYPSLLMAPTPDAPCGPEGPGASLHLNSQSKLKVLKKRLRDFLDLKATSAAKRPKTEKLGSDVKN